MKIYLLLLMLIGVSCSKDNEKRNAGCWECEKTANSPGDKVEVCNDSQTAPTTNTDGAGNTYTVKNCKK